MNAPSNIKRPFTSSFGRVIVAWLACLFLVAGIGFLWWYQHVGPGYYSELETIRRQLQGIPHVEIVELSGHDDTDFPLLRNLEHITARIKVADKVDMVFSELSKDSFRDAKHVILVEVGPYRTRYRGDGYVGVYNADTRAPVRSEFAGGPVDIGQNGDFAHLFPFAITNIQTAVAHHEDILEIVSRWPETPSPPRHFKNSEDTDFYYWVTTKTDDEHDPLWSQPYSALREK